MRPPTLLVPWLLLAAVRAQAQTMSPASGSPASGAWAPPGGTLQTVGVRAASLRPTSLSVTVGVDGRAATATDALARLALLTEQVTRALLRTGVTSDSTTTTAVVLQPEWVYVQGARPRLNGYVATQDLRVRAPIAGAGPILDAVTTAGVTRIQQLTFESVPGAALRDSLMDAAMRAARHDADLLARAAGAVVTHVIEASAEDALEGSDPPRPMLMARAVDGAAASSVSAGTQHYRVRVTARWAVRPLDRP